LISTLSFSLDRAVVPLAHSIRTSTLIYDRDWGLIENLGVSETFNVDLAEQLKGVIGLRAEIARSVVLDRDRNLAFAHTHYWDDPSYIDFVIFDITDPMNPTFHKIDEEFIMDSPSFTWEFTGENTLEYKVYHNGQNDDINEVVRTGTYDLSNLR